MRLPMIISLVTLMAITAQAFDLGARAPREPVRLTMPPAVDPDLLPLGGGAGAYQLAVEAIVPCVLDCPPGAQLEGEPPLVNGYNDAYNCGCGCPEWNNPMLEVNESVFCGVSGWYMNNDGGHSRDTDYLLATIPDDGVLEITGDAELPLYLFELGPQDCDEVDVVQLMVVGPCEENTMVISGEAGSVVWLWAGPTIFDTPDGTYPYEFDYVLQLNLPVAVEAHRWSSVKALYSD